MSAPRHLWSGDWREESSAHAEALAAGRAQREEPAAGRAQRAEPAARPDRRQETVKVERAAATRRPPSRTFLDRLRSLRLGSRGRLRVAGLVASLTVLSAAGAYVLTSLVVRVMGGA